ncbi:hypothetical protein [Stratiformator vulcanicus]|uniref:Uncharacterized protein n=1 Tax=Stratiformator vulcanicus TaxID=2527980 RepID=A0A517QZ03_9PLAN|nr:hypothetical protein [Stratiformator vulcanicus]QDT36834.1 hypothetical protein Pan189_11970 [Stratiformator vulcanicus]
MPAWSKHYIVCGVIGLVVGVVWMAVGSTIVLADLDGETVWSVVLPLFAALAVFAFGLPFRRPSVEYFARLFVATTLGLPLGWLCFFLVGNSGDFFPSFASPGGIAAVALCGAAFGLAHGLLTLLMSFELKAEPRVMSRNDYLSAIAVFVITGAFLAVYTTTVFHFGHEMRRYVDEIVFVGLVFSSFLMMPVIGSIPVGYLRSKMTAPEGP